VRINPVTATRIRFTIDNALACPVINKVRLLKPPKGKRLKDYPQGWFR
jgi:hypothetical protein